MKKVSEVIQYFENLYSSGAIYVWGSNGEVITKELCDRLYAKYGSATYNAAYYNAKFLEGAGRIGADCSGAMCPMSGFDDTAQGYYNRCSVKGSINYIDRNVACLVFKGQTAASIHHIGFYCGNGYVIEMQSSKTNCVKSPLDKGNWNFFGIPLWIDYTVRASKGVDLSHMNNVTDFGAVKKSGVDFVILRTILKAGTTDKKFEEYYKKADAAGLKIGVYMYSYDLSEMQAITSAQKVIGLLDGRKVPIFLDLEDKSQISMGKSGIAAIAKAFIQTCNQYGYQCYIYCNENWYKNYIDDTIKPYAIWIARYGNNDGVSSIAYKPGLGEKIWQYTSKGSVNGIQGNVDCNLCYDMSIFESGSNTITGAVQNQKTTYTVTPINIMGVIKASGLRIRQEPNTSSSILGSYSNEIVKLVGQTNNGWYQTERGYISGQYVEFLQGKVVNCNKVNVRQTASKDSKSLAVIPVNELVLIIVGLGDWFNVITKDNIVGWIKKDYIELQV